PASKLGTEDLDGVPSSVAQPIAGPGRAASGRGTHRHRNRLSRHRPATGFQTKRPVLIPRVRRCEPLEQPMHVVILRGAQLIPDAPDFFDGAFLLHPSKLPSTRGACKPRGACRLEPSIPRPTSARSWRCGCVGSSKSAENPSHARTQTQYAPHPGLRAVV